MSRWHDDDRIIAVQPIVICFSWERQVSVAPKNVYRPSIFFFLHHFPVALAVNKSPAVYALSPALDGLWTETRRLKSFPWDALVYGSIMAFYLNLEKLGKPERCVMLWATMSTVTCMGWFNVLMTVFIVARVTGYNFSPIHIPFLLPP